MLKILTLAVSLSTALNVNATEYVCRFGPPGEPLPIIMKKDCEGSDPINMTCKSFSVYERGKRAVVTDKTLGIGHYPDGTLKLQPNAGVSFIPIETDDNIYALSLSDTLGGESAKEFYVLVSGETNTQASKILDYVQFHRKMVLANINLGDNEAAREVCLRH